MTSASCGVANAHSFENLLAFTLLTAISGIGLFSLVFSSSGVQSESVVWIMLGGSVLFLVPGLVLAEVVGFRARHTLEAVALSLALSLLIEVLLLPAPFLFGTSIRLWLSLLLSACVVGLAVIALRLLRQQSLRFLPALWKVRPSSKSDVFAQFAVLALTGGMAALAYHAGDDARTMGGEKLLHLSFVRMYFTLPLRLEDLAIERGAPPQNLVHFWEFLLAGWAHLSHTDPLLIFSRARFVLPLFGLAGTYLLIREIFAGSRKRLAVFFGVLLLCLSELILWGPGLAWVKDGDSSRGVFAFLGTAHHADAAQEILLVLTAGFTLRTLRRRTLIDLVTLLGLFAASFLWHPREFIQTALYIGILVLTVLAFPHLRRKTVLYRLAAVVGVLGASAVLLFALSQRLGTGARHNYDEFALKRTALRYSTQAIHLAGVRNLYNFPLHFGLNSTLAPDEMFTSQKIRELTRSEWQKDSWLYLAGVAAVLLFFLGDRRDRTLAGFFVLLWFVALAWTGSMLVILALTYSEFYMTTPRLLYLFAYLVSAAALVAVQSRLLGAGPLSLRRSLLVSGAFVLVGLLFWWWARNGGSYHQPIAWLLTAALGAGFLLAIVRRDGAATQICPSRLPLVMAGCLLFFAPLLIQNGVQAAKNGRLRSAHTPHWFDRANPLGLSVELVQTVQQLPPQERLLTYPGLHWLTVYSPQYYVIVPGAAVIRDNAARLDMLEGRHVFYRPQASDNDPAPNHSDTIRWLTEKDVNLIFLNEGQYSRSLRDYFASHPDDFALEFDRPETRELLVRFLGTQHPR